MPEIIFLYISILLQVEVIKTFFKSPLGKEYFYGNLILPSPYFLHYWGNPGKYLTTATGIRLGAAALFSGGLYAGIEHSDAVSGRTQGRNARAFIQTVREYMEETGATREEAEKFFGSFENWQNSSRRNAERTIVGNLTAPEKQTSIIGGVGPGGIHASWTETTKGGLD